MKKLCLVICVFGLIFMLATGLQASLSDGLVAYYPFNGNANDESGNGNDGSPVGDVTWTSGVLGGAAHFNGASYINVPDSPSLDLPGGRGTISAFIKVDSSSDEFGIVSKESSSSFPSTIAYEFNVRHSGTYETFLISDGATTNWGKDAGVASLKDSTWHHVAAIWSGPGGEIIIYRDGVQIIQSNQTISTINNISEPVRIGAFRWNVSGMYRYMTGDIDEVCIYDRALSASEIAELAGIPEPTCTVLDDFEDGVIDPILWVTHGRKGGQGAFGTGGWQYSFAEYPNGDGDGYLEARVWGPKSGLTYWGEASVRTTYNFNDGNQWLINFTWETTVGYNPHVDWFAIQITDGGFPQIENAHWLCNVPPGTINLWLTGSGGEPDQPVAPFSKRTWSIAIDTAGTASFYQSPNAEGTAYSQVVLDLSKEWYIRFVQVDATSSGFDGGDNTFKLYDFSAVCGEVGPADIAAIRIREAIAEKVEVLERIDAALEEEWTAYEALEELLESGDYGDLKKGDIVAAKQKIHSAIQHQDQSKKALEKSIEKLKDSLDLLGQPLLPSPYSWLENNGHHYALTLEHGTWEQAEAEAVAAGGHLVTINDADENEWITEFVKDVYVRGCLLPITCPGSNVAWIGYRRVNGEWGWVSGEPVAYTNFLNWYSGVYAYIHGGNHPSSPGAWNNNPAHDDNYEDNTIGIIEVPW